MSHFATQYQGEINETVQRGKGTLVEKSNYPSILRGANLTMFVVREASQGKNLFLNDVKYLKGKNPESKSYHHRLKRIGFQRSSPQNNFRRLIAAPINPGFYCFDTVSYVTEQSTIVNLDVLLLYLNSILSDWYFRLSSTNSKVNEYQFNALPFFQSEKIDTPPDILTLLEKNHYPDVIIKLDRYIKQYNKVPNWAMQILRKISQDIQVIEQKRIITSRKQRSSLSRDSSYLQRYADIIFFTIFQLSEEDSSYIENRVDKTL